MLRGTMLRLWRHLQPDQRQSVYLDGPVGGGKSIALASTVHWARAAGWVVR